MTNKDLFREASIALTSNKLRTGLTILGIVVGISSVIILSAIGNGAQETVTKQIQSNGSNLLTINGGAQRGFTGGSANVARGQSNKILTVDDYEAVRDIYNVKYSSPVLSRQYQVIYNRNNIRTTINGVYPAIKDIRNLELIEGRFWTDFENNNRVAVLGATTRNDLFASSSVVIGEKIRINNVNFTVIGILKSKGGSGFGNQDDNIYIPLQVMASDIVGEKKYVNQILISSNNVEDLPLISAEIDSILTQTHNISGKKTADWSVFNQSDIIETSSNITGIFTLLLSAVASISLIVGGIGIMNMMLTQVTERTKEIGLRKALGAESGDIKRQFLIESIYITGFGGVIGIIFGVSVSLILGLSGVLATAISTQSIIIAFVVSVTIGIVFGIYPASKASALSPIQALKYE